MARVKQRFIITSKQSKQGKQIDIDTSGFGLCLPPLRRTCGISGAAAPRRGRARGAAGPPGRRAAQRRSPSRSLGPHMTRERTSKASRAGVPSHRVAHTPAHPAPRCTRSGARDRGASRPRVTCRDAELSPACTCPCRRSSAARRTGRAAASTACAPEINLELALRARAHTFGAWAGRVRSRGSRPVKGALQVRRGLPRHVGDAREREPNGRERSNNFRFRINLSKVRETEPNVRVCESVCYGLNSGMF